jgi:hypothetical protein
MTMKYKVKKNDSFEVLPRATLQDPRLRMEELGLLVRLISYPPDWELRVSQIRKTTGWGRDKTRAVLRRLEELGYIKREAKNGKNGTFYWLAEIYPEAQPVEIAENKEENENQEPSPENAGMEANPCPGSPYDGPPCDGEHGHIYNTQLNNTELKNTPPPPPEPDSNQSGGGGESCDHDVEEYLAYCKQQAERKGVEDVAGWVEGARRRIMNKQGGKLSDIDMQQVKQWRQAAADNNQVHEEDMEQYARAGKDII